MSQSSIANILAALALILLAFRARTLSIVRKLCTTFAEAKSLALLTMAFTIEMSGVRDRKRKMVVGLNEMYMENYRKTGAEFLWGTGRFVARERWR